MFHWLLQQGCLGIIMMGQMTNYYGLVYYYYGYQYCNKIVVIFD